ncbi:MAG: SpoIIE family protein phosphatase [Chlamydiae bacterium]|nr:SpoIIE family protein phosphatase [Chlamydiota bacterium]MBI3277782.1 SpoIIE family protein phosphatase [Chlamydiota bacterium]
MPKSPETETTKYLEERIQKLYGLIEASTLVISTLQIDEVLHLVMEIAKRVVDAQASSLLILDSKTGLLGYEVALGEKGEEVKGKFSLKLGQGIAGWVAQSGKPLLVPDVEKDDRFFKGSDQTTGFRTRSILCVPMLVQDQVTGVIEVINSNHGGPFTQDDLELLSAFSSLAAIAIENARLTQKKLEQQALEQELEIAHQIQDNFLKREFPLLKRIEAYAKLRSAHEIGGDFYDFVNLGQNRWGFLIGDVTGRGVPAALYMMRTLTEFRMEAFSDFEISKILERLNDRLVKKSTMGMFVTLAYLRIDTKTGRAALTNAGHLPLHIYRAKNRKIERVMGEGGLALGIIHHSKIPMEEVTLEKGDMVIMITDGLIEAKNPKGKEFGWEKFEEFFNDESPASPQEVAEGLFLKLDRFCGHFAIPDDVTVVAVKYKG